MIAIIDYGMGNLRSVQKAFEKVGAQVMLTSSSSDLTKADKIVLPGVGAMAPAMARLQELGLVDSIRRVVKEGKPFFGICLGLQLLFEQSAEGGTVKGLGILEGSVEKFTQGKVPHMGWNQIKILSAGKDLYKGITDEANVYFCHSYYVKPTSAQIAASTTSYNISYISSVVQDNIWGVQFHPEKSQNVGLQILKNFTQL